jgi:altronate hydrolase
VAGATILSLGCQNAEVSILQEEIHKRNAKFQKPLLIFDQQKSSVESAMLTKAIRETFLELARANELQRAPAPLSALTIGLKCGGSDGFSGLSAHPAIGHVSDLIGAAVYLASEAGACVTGQLLAVAGGILASGVNQ